MENTIGTILTTTSILTLIYIASIFILQNWIKEKIKNEVKLEYDKELASHKNKLSIELELVKAKLGPYSEKQFTIYNDLWVHLNQLKISTEKLWLDLSSNNMDEFLLNILKTRDIIGNSALLIEEKHYSDFIQILDEFIYYKNGKQILIDLRRSLQPDKLNQPHINKIIDENEVRKEKLLNKIDEIRISLKNQIHGTSVNHNDAH